MENPTEALQPFDPDFYPLGNFDVESLNYMDPNVFADLLQPASDPPGSVANDSGWPSTLASSRLKGIEDFAAILDNNPAKPMVINPELANADIKHHNPRQDSGVGLAKDRMPQHVSFGGQQIHSYGLENAAEMSASGFTDTMEPLIMVANQIPEQAAIPDVQSTGNDHRVKTDTEDSWNEDEHSGRSAEYFQRVKDLVRNVAATPGAYAITAPLPLRLRKAVHLLAHLDQCSHMSLGLRKGRDRRVLIASDGLRPELLLRAKRRECWNSSKSNFWIDPRSIKVKIIPGDLSQAAFESVLRSEAAPAPIKWEYRRSDEPLLRDGVRYSTNVAFAEFEDAEDVAKFVESYQGQCLRAGDSLRLIIQYARIRRENVNLGVRFEIQSSLTEGVTFHESTAYNSAQRMAGTTTSFVGCSPEQLNKSRFAQTGGYSSAADSSTGCSSASQCTDYSSEASGTKKRKRNPMIPMGYQCQYEGCDRRFNYLGERTKHERIHMPRDMRPFGCGFCGLKFLDAKDLKRHEYVHIVAGRP